MTTLLAPQLPVVVRPIFTIEDRWLAALDGRMVYLDDVAYPLVIQGIHHGVDSDLWIQLAPFEQGDRDMERADLGVTLHCHASAEPHDALQVLSGHLVAHGARCGGRLEVA